MQDKPPSKNKRYAMTRHPIAENKELQETVDVLDLQLSECSKSYDKLEANYNELIEELVEKDRVIARLTAVNETLSEGLSGAFQIKEDLRVMRSAMLAINAIAVTLRGLHAPKTEKFLQGIDDVCERSAKAIMAAGEGL